MGSVGGYIALHRQMLNWEWYKNTNTKVLFIHLLLRANYKDLSFEGHKILRGQLVTSLPSLASETGLSQRQIRVSLDKLILTGEVSSKTYPRYRVITITKYDEYQVDDRLNGSQMTGETAAKRQADDRLMTGSWQADDRLMTASIENNKDNNIDKGINEKRESGKTAKRFTPPTREEVELFCLENGLTIDIDRFLNYYESNGWMVGRNKMKDWQATVRNWSTGSTQRQAPAQKKEPAKRVTAQEYEQRDYHDIQEEFERAQTERIIARLRAEGRTDV